MKTKWIMEALMHKDPNLHKVLNVLNVIAPGRLMSSVERREYDNILKPFCNGNLKFLCVIGMMETIFIIGDSKSFRSTIKFNLMIVRGNVTEITELSAGTLVSEAAQALNHKDFLPSPVVSKIIFVDDYSGSNPKGLIFSETFPNHWTIDDPFELNLNMREQSATGRQIIDMLVDSLKD